MTWLVALIVYALAAYSLTFHLQFAELYDVPRNLLRGGDDEVAERNFVQRFFFRLFDCAFCLGTWSGLVLGGGILLSLSALGHAPVPVLSFLLVLLSSLVSGTICFFGYVFTQKLL
jgi:hypothetical protein